MKSKYECQGCGANEVKLWRRYQTFLENQKLLCIDCAEKDQNEKLNADHSSIGWLVPAVPTKEGDPFWGYTSIPEYGMKWWNDLLLRRSGIRSTP